VAMAVPVTVAGALTLEWLRQNRRISGDIGLAILMSSGLAVAIVLVGLAEGRHIDFASYLFGSITTTSPADVITLAIAAGVVLAIVAMNYRALVHIAFDEDSARIAGRHVSLLNYTLVAVTALVVVLSLHIIGGLLISALIVMPVMTAARFAHSFAQTVLLAIGFAVVAVLSGLILAFYAGIAAGGAIVLSALVLLIAALIYKK